jgi:GGDEF domain-containing protein
MLIGGRQVPIRASIGVATTDDRGAEGADLLARADQAMYREKRAAR